MIPFSEIELLEFSSRDGVGVKARVMMKDSRLNFSFTVTGENTNRFPPLLSPEFRERKDNLWKADCFEIFWDFGQNDYYELNLSPSGHWQVYHFIEQRSGRTELSVHAPCLSSSQSQDEYCYQGELNFSAHQSIQPLKVHPCVVLNDGPLKTRYYAAAHTQGAPDFHNKSCWQII